MKILTTPSIACFMNNNLHLPSDLISARDLEICGYPMLRSSKWTTVLAELMNNYSLHYLSSATGDWLDQAFWLYSEDRVEELSPNDCLVGLFVTSWYLVAGIRDDERRGISELPLLGALVFRTFVPHSLISPANNAQLKQIWNCAMDLRHPPSEWSKRYFAIVQAVFEPRSYASSEILAHEHRAAEDEYYSAFGTSTYAGMSARNLCQTLIDRS